MITIHTHIYIYMCCMYIFSKKQYQLYQLINSSNHGKNMSKCPCHELNTCLCAYSLVHAESVSWFLGKACYPFPKQSARTGALWSQTPWHEGQILFPCGLPRQIFWWISIGFPWDVLGIFPSTDPWRGATRLLPNIWRKVDERRPAFRPTPHVGDFDQGWCIPECIFWTTSCTSAIQVRQTSNLAGSCAQALSLGKGCQKNMQVGPCHHRTPTRSCPLGGSETDRTKTKPRWHDDKSWNMRLIIKQKNWVGLKPFTTPNVCGTLWNRISATATARTKGSKRLHVS